jgi:hypothetical protein
MTAKVIHTAELPNDSYIEAWSDGDITVFDGFVSINLKATDVDAFIKAMKKCKQQYEHLKALVIISNVMEG